MATFWFSDSPERRFEAVRVEGGIPVVDASTWQAILEWLDPEAAAAARAEVRPGSDGLFTLDAFGWAFSVA